MVVPHALGETSLTPTLGTRSAREPDTSRGGNLVLMRDAGRLEYLANKGFELRTSIDILMPDKEVISGALSASRTSARCEAVAKMLIIAIE